MHRALKLAYASGLEISVCIGPWKRMHRALKAYASGLEAYASGLEAYASGLEAYASGLEAYASGLEEVL